MKPFIIYLSSVATIGVLILFKTDVLLSTMLVALLSFLLLVIEFSAGRLIIYILVLTLAPLAEILMVHMGLWSFASQSVFGVPFWIPFFWINCVFFFIQVKESVDTHLSKHSS